MSNCVYSLVDHSDFLFCFSVNKISSSLINPKHYHFSMIPHIKYKGFQRFEIWKSISKMFSLFHDKGKRLNTCSNNQIKLIDNTVTGHCDGKNSLN